MKIKRLLLVLACLCLVGCGTGTQKDISQSQEETEKKLYEGMNGQETYLAAIDYFNQNVTYYKSIIKDDMSQSELEYFKEENVFAVVTKALYYDGTSSMLNYNIVSGNDFHSLFMNEDGIYEYEIMNDYAESYPSMCQDLSQKEGYELIDVTRKDQENTIILTLKVKYEDVDINDIEYYMSEITIDSQGYICEEKMTYYSDEDFQETLGMEISVINLQFNQKSLSDLEKEIDLMESCQGLSDAEVRTKIGLDDSFVE